MNWLKEMREIAEKATQSKWDWYETGTTYGINSDNMVVDTGKARQIAYTAPNVMGTKDGIAKRKIINKHNAQYIAKANPQTMLRLLDVVEEMQINTEHLKIIALQRNQNELVEKINTTLAKLEQGPQAKGKGGK